MEYSDPIIRDYIARMKELDVRRRDVSRIVTLVLGLIGVCLFFAGYTFHAAYTSDLALGLCIGGGLLAAAGILLLTLSQRRPSDEEAHAEAHGRYADLYDLLSRNGLKERRQIEPLETRIRDLLSLRAGERASIVHIIEQAMTIFPCGVLVGFLANLLDPSALTVQRLEQVLILVGVFSAYYLGLRLLFHSCFTGGAVLVRSRALERLEAETNGLLASTIIEDRLAEIPEGDAPSAF